MTATIAASVIASADVQVDGRTWVQEIHTDSLGVSYPHFYLAPVDADLQANLTAWRSALLVDLQQGETARNLDQILNQGANAIVSFNYSTVGQSVAALKAMTSISRGQIANLAAYLLTLPPAQLNNVFGITAQQLLALQNASPALVTAVTNLAAAMAALNVRVIP